jgi:serine/threonine protein kinase
MADDFEQLVRQVADQLGLTIEERCGSGAFKHTYRATRGDDTFALKVVVGDLPWERIERETAALQRCRHPHISRLHESGSIRDAKGRPVAYFLEEFLDAGTLSQRLANSQIVALEEGRAIGLAMSSALLHLDELHIVHRDIKPDNIMFRRNGAAVLLDLGIARHVVESTLTQQWAAAGPGTPVFAAPEQLRNEIRQIDWRTDQFGLGVTMSVALLGMYPHSGSASFQGVVDRVVARQPPSDAFVDVASRRGLGLLRTMVDPWPARRYRRPDDLVAAWDALEV